MAVQSLYILTKEPGSGSFFVAMGFLEILKRRYKRVAIFKPVVGACGEEDEDLANLRRIFRLSQSYESAVGVDIAEVEEAVAHDRPADIYEQVIATFEKLREEYDFVLCLPCKDAKLKDLIDFDIDIEMAKNLATPIVGVIDARGKSAEQVHEETDVWRYGMKKEGVELFCFILNRAAADVACEAAPEKPFGRVPCFVIPYEARLDRPIVLDLLAISEAEVVLNDNESALQRTMERPLIAAMHPEHFLTYLRPRDVVVAPADRADILLAIMTANRVGGFPSVSAVVVGGHMPIDETIKTMMARDESFNIPVIRVPYDTMTIVEKAKAARPHLTERHKRKIDLALGHFAEWVDTALIEESLRQSEVEIVTPTMFLHRLFADAGADPRRIVLPESDDDRILHAAEAVTRRKIARVTLLGRPERITNRADMLGVDLEGVEIVDPATSERAEAYARTFYELRKAKGVTPEQAADTMKNVTYFATMMVYTGDADGMVSGATHTTRETVKPALQIIKTKPGIDIVSSVFFMCLDTRVLVYGDCAIVPDPNPRELAQIAVESARTARAFGIDPRVAMLSYSTGESGVGEDVQKVREATKLARQAAPDIPIEGPMQYDAAVDPEVGKKKMPGSKVAGRATVFVFPDLNTGNNTYKAVQRSTGAVNRSPP